MDDKGHFSPTVPWAFCSWSQETQARGLPQKAELLLDTAPSHPNESLLAFDDGLITSQFLPPNVTATIQPLDQGVISAMKCLNRSELLKNLIHEVTMLPNFWKQYSLSEWNFIMEYQQHGQR